MDKREVKKLKHKLRPTKKWVIFDYCEVCGEGFLDKKGVRTKYCPGKPKNPKS